MKISHPILWSLAVLGLLLTSLTGSAAEPVPPPPPAEEPAIAPPDQPVAEESAAPVPEVEMVAEPDPPQPGEPTPEPTEPRPGGANDAPAAAVPTPSATPPGPAASKPEAAPTAAASDAAEVAATAPAAPVTPVKPGEKGLRLNFRGASLDQVLSYLSEAAGFVIVLETKVDGKVDVWSNQLLDQDEAVQLLNTVLNKNGYAALRNGRTLTIISRDDAKKRNTPVIVGGNPTDIPKTDDIVTQIIPLRFINAVQVSRDLQTLIPSSANVAANEGGNALMITDTQTNVRRLAEIIKALDNSISSSYTIKVFPLQYADAKTLATVIRDIFQTQESNARGTGNAVQQFISRFRGGPGGGFGGPGGGGDAGAAGNGGGRPGASRVVAVADDRSNSVVVSAPEDVMPSVEGLVKAVDVSIEDVTELRVFHLQFADPVEMADLLTSLFPDTTGSQSGGGRGQFRFGGPFGGNPFGGGNASAAGSSERLLKQTRVMAVADQRTRSVVVSASRTMMEQIAPMVEQLDNDPARKRKVFVYDVENTDPQAVQDIIETLFPEQNIGNTRNNRSSRQQQNTSQLNNRQTQTRNQGRTSTIGSGNTGLGGGGFGTGGNR